MTLYDQLSQSVIGRRALAGGRLRYRVLDLLHEALRRSGKTQAEVAHDLGVRRSAANQVFRGEGNLRVNTIAEYLDAMGYEVRLEIAERGTLRSEALAGVAVKTERILSASQMQRQIADVLMTESAVAISGKLVVHQQASSEVESNKAYAPLSEYERVRVPAA